MNLLMPNTLTAENGAKALLSGEFEIQHQVICSACHYDEADPECEVCAGEIEYTAKVKVDWPTIKAIYNKAAATLGQAVTDASVEQAALSFVQAKLRAAGRAHPNAAPVLIAEALEHIDQVMTEARHEPVTTPSTATAGHHPSRKVIGLKMAKPSARDVEAAEELLQVLQLIDARFGGPWPDPDAPESLEDALNDEAFDSDNERHLKALYNNLARLLRTAPNFHGRVISGMCHVIMNEKNQLIDPESDVIDLHPHLAQLQDRAEKLEAECETLRGLVPEPPPRPPEGDGLPRYGLRSNGPRQPLSVPMDDGYWTPWHLAEAACVRLREPLKEIVRQYPNPDISHADYRAHACRHAELALAGSKEASDD